MIPTRLGARPAIERRSVMRRRFGHHLLIASAAASLALCVVACVLWVRSYRSSDAVRVASPRLGYGIAYSGRGGVMLGATREGTVFPSGLHYHVEEDPEPAGDGPSGWVAFDVLGFGMRAERPPYVVAAYAVWFPHWFAVLGLSVLPARALARRATLRKRARRGLCGACGYDLRGTPRGCPECGAAAGLAEVGGSGA